MSLRFVVLITLASAPSLLAAQGLASGRLLTRCEIQRFVAQLASPSEKKCQEARRILLATGRASVKELFLAQSADDKVLAMRARETLKEIPGADVLPRSADDKLVDNARVEFFDLVPHSRQLVNAPFARGSTGSGGGLSIPALPPRGEIAVRLTHPELVTTITRFT